MFLLLTTVAPFLHSRQHNQYSKTLQQLSILRTKKLPRNIVIFYSYNFFFCEGTDSILCFVDHIQPLSHIQVFSGFPFTLLKRFKNVKTIFSFQTIQKQATCQIWPVDSSLSIIILEGLGVLFQLSVALREILRVLRSLQDNEGINYANNMGEIPQEKRNSAKSETNLAQLRNTKQLSWLKHSIQRAK